MSHTEQATVDSAASRIVRALGSFAVAAVGGTAVGVLTWWLEATAPREVYRPLAELPGGWVLCAFGSSR